MGKVSSLESPRFPILITNDTFCRKPSPALDLRWPLSWIHEVLTFPDSKFNELRGVDASLYVRFLKGCGEFTTSLILSITYNECAALVRFTLAQTLTTFPILLPIHVTFSDDSVSPKSMIRASISSLVNTAKGSSLLWIHLLLLIWVTLSWMATLHWIIRGTFQFRAAKIKEAAQHAAGQKQAEKDSQYHPHPHPQYPFMSLPPLDEDHSTKGLRARTIMVTNIPSGLRSEKELKEYFEYYMSRPVPKPSMGMSSSAQPGFVDRSAAFVFNKGVRLVARLLEFRTRSGAADHKEAPDNVKQASHDVPVIDRVVIVRKMSELASLLERREEVLRSLETAHIKLARNALEAVDAVVNEKSSTTTVIRSVASRLSFGLVSRGTPSNSLDVERAAGSNEGTTDGEDRMHLLVRVLSPYLHDHRSGNALGKWLRSKTRLPWRSTYASSALPHRSSGNHIQPEYKTIWEALLSLPRSTLDTYQPLVHLSALFRGKTVPAVDYYTAKLNLLTGLITEERSLPPNAFTAVSTAFVTFADPADARRACTYLAGHPNNPVNVCLVTMAPSYEDLDWTRLMKSTYRVEVGPFYRCKLQLDTC
jgi:hypothetical protein